MAFPRLRPTTNRPHARSLGGLWVRRREIEPGPTSLATDPRDSDLRPLSKSRPARQRWALLTLLLIALASLPFVLPHLRALGSRPAAFSSEASDPAPPPPYSLRAAWRDIHRPYEPPSRQPRTLAPVTSVLEDVGTAAPTGATELSRDTTIDPPPSRAALLAEKMAAPLAPVTSAPASIPSRSREETAEAAPEPPRHAMEPESAIAVPESDRAIVSSLEAAPSTVALPFRNPRWLRDSRANRQSNGRAVSDPLASPLSRVQGPGRGTSPRQKPRYRTASPAPRPDTPDTASPQGMSVFLGLGRVMP